MFVVFLALAFSAKATYTLTDADVEMDANGYIISCSYSFIDKDIIIPETLDGVTVKGIGVDYNNLFYNKDIVTIQFPSTIEFIGRYAFFSNMLTSVDIPAGITSIEERAFSSNRLTSITIPSGITSIGENAFSYNLLTSVTIPDGVKYIGPSAFRSCNIASISLSGTVISIGEFAFNRNELTSVTIPNSVSFIGSEAFGLNTLTSFVLPTLTAPGFVDWLDSDGNHYAGGATASGLSAVYRANLPYTLTDADVEMDANGYIISCTYSFDASMITIPETLDGYAVKGIGDDYKHLFFEKAITSVLLPAGLEYIGTSAFSYNMLTALTIPANVDSIGNHAFSYNLLTNISIPDMLVFIGDNAFQMNMLTNVTLSDNVTSIGSDAFRNNQLTNISIPAKVIFVGSNAFNYNEITEFTLPSPTIPGFIDWIDGNGNHFEPLATVTDLSTYYKAFVPYILSDDDVEMDANGYIISCSYNFEEKDIEIPEILDGYTVKGIKDNIWSAGIFASKGITFVKLPSSIEHIGDYAFAKNLITGIYIPETLTVIGAFAFTENRIKNLVLPEGVLSIGNSAFYNNKMESVALPNSITSISRAAFSQNYINSINIPGGLTRIEQDVFWGNYLTSLKIPEGVTYIGDNAFGGNALTSIELPNSLITITEGAFRRNQLSQVTIPNSVTYISSSAFSENLFSSFLLTTPTLPGFINWVDNNDNYFEGGAEVPVEKFSTNAYRARITYTLKNEDVVMDSNGYIISCSYNFQASIITIPEVLDGVAVKGIADGDTYTGGVFSTKMMLSFQLPEGIEYIGDYSFAVNYLTDIDIPNTVTSIGDFVFAGNQKLTHVSFSNSVISIGRYVFLSCYQFAGFTLPTLVQSGFYDWIDDKANVYQAGDSIKYDLFSNSFRARFTHTLTDDDVEVDTNGYITSYNYKGPEEVIIIPETLDGYNVKGIADAPSDYYTGVFYYKKIGVIKLPSGLEYIGSYAFGANDLKNIVIPNSVISIGLSAFLYNKLTGIVLPTPDIADFVDWVEVNSGIGYEAGDTVTDLSGYYRARFGYVLTDADVEVDANGYIISCSYIGDETNIIIPDTLDGYAVKGIVDGILDLGGSVKKAAAANSGVFYNKAITSVKLPLGLEYIGAYAFNSNQLGDISIPNNVLSIGAYAFAENPLSGFVLPTPSIKDFVGWIEVNSGNHYAGGEYVTDFSGFYQALFAYVLQDEDVEMDANGYIMSCSYSFDNKDIIIPDSLDGIKVIGIDDGAVDAGVFYNKAITSVSIPQGIEYIGDYAFNTNQLSDIIIPNGVSFIGAGAFGSNVLTTFVLPNITESGFIDWLDANGTHYAGGATVTDLSTNYRAIFQYTITDADVEMDVNGYIISCSYSFMASMITIPETLDGYLVKGIGDDYTNLFYDKAIISIGLPSGLEVIGTYAFSNNLLTSVSLPDGVTLIGDEAFSNNLLSAITIPNTVSYIGISAFNSNPLTAFVLPEAYQEGYTFDNWNGSIAANTEVTDLAIAYTANFSLISGMENFGDFDVRLYPNPAKDFVMIESEDIYSVELISISGVRLQKLKVAGTHCKIDLSSQDSGIYLLRIEGKYGACVIRVMKE